MKSDDIAEYVLSKLGFSVEKIARSDVEKRPDFKITRGSASAIVEAKLRCDDPEESERREQTLSKGDVYVSEHVLGRSETISGVVRKAARQLAAGDRFGCDFKLLLMIADCINARTVRDQLIDTLYGTTRILELGTRPPRIKPCYFYRHADFFSRKHIDGAIVGYVDPASKDIQMRFCLNPYSLRYDMLVVSDIALPFGSALLDPIVEERCGRAFLPDADVDRTKQPFMDILPQSDPILLHLAKKYDTGPLRRFDFEAPLMEVRSP